MPEISHQVSRHQPHWFQYKPLPPCCLYQQCWFKEGSWHQLLIVCTGVNSGVDVDWFCSNGTRLNLGSSTVAITYSGRLRMSSNRLCSKLCRCSLKVLYCISHETNMQSIPNSGTSKRQTGEGRLNRMCVQSSLCQLWQDLSAKLERNLELLLRVSR